jgi:hypothetical protein
MELDTVEGAVNSSGSAAVFISPLRHRPSGASIVGRRVVLDDPAFTAFRVAKPVADAAKKRRWLLLIEIADGKVVRDTPVPIRGEPR